MAEELDGATVLRELWLATGISISLFADLLGEKRQSIKDIIGGKKRLPADLLLKVPQKIPVNPLWLMGDKSQPIFLPDAPYPVPTNLSRKERLDYLNAGDAAQRGDVDKDRLRVKMPADDYLTDWPKNFAEEFVCIRHYDVIASMGTGIENGDEAIKQWNAYRRSFWLKEIGYPPGECFSTDLDGVSMSPFLTDRHVPIFHRESEVLHDSVYVFRQHGKNFVKKLQRIPGEGIMVSSYDKTLETWMVRGDKEENQEEDFIVIGRLVFKQLGERV
ncbi:MAG TPA: S24 family peptidase [Usitatibacteraceae bacterium]